MSVTSHKEIGRVGRVGRQSSWGCHEDATRKTVPWNLSYIYTAQQRSIVHLFRR